LSRLDRRARSSAVQGRSDLLHPGPSASETAARHGTAIDAVSRNWAEMRRPSSCMDPPGLAATGGKPGQSQNPDTDYLTSRKRTLPKPHEYGDPIIVLPRWPGIHLVSKPRSLDALVCARGQLPVRCSYLARAAVVLTRRLRARTSHRCPWVWRTPSGSSKSIRRCRSGAFWAAARLLCQHGQSACGFLRARGG